ncbi:hypothetical protein GLOTRDRAFT_96838 [Gloeophyllum trabeum ATCC 11539]|uniref:DUF6534 domain-containing protein n=1 Tax=Gloeophyllum trabeum (strain ATCC 11539 / FP-39264 / Madison 617) TaxID=670483 RepID=S7PU13_GLOTA|nr:uncharacterized protein GLOTRDRAFT_96838 [Gloeophyllum trabeum ATCC 11539]EPQ50938.1 hypothetical protein GLOTRDRAFT_96838 [Gloeophyllum trabeum ATCC 11539]
MAVRNSAEGPRTVRYRVRVLPGQTFHAAVYVITSVHVVSAPLAVNALIASVLIFTGRLTNWEFRAAISSAAMNAFSYARPNAIFAALPNMLYLMKTSQAPSVDGYIASTRLLYVFTADTAPEGSAGIYGGQLPYRDFSPGLGGRYAQGGLLARPRTTSFKAATGWRPSSNENLPVASTLFTWIRSIPSMDSDQGSTPLNLRKYAFVLHSNFLWNVDRNSRLQVSSMADSRHFLRYVFVTFTSYIAHQIMVMHSGQYPSPPVIAAWTLIGLQLSLETAERLVWSVIVRILLSTLLGWVDAWQRRDKHFVISSGPTILWRADLAYFSALKHFGLSSVCRESLEATDIAVAASLSITLLRKKPGKHGSRTTHTMIHTLVAYCVNTGLTTSRYKTRPNYNPIGQVITLQDHYIYICFYFIIGGTYINSLLANLNGRRAIRGSSTDHIHMSGEISYALSTLDRSVELGPAQSSPDPSQKGAGHEEAPEDPSPVRVKFDREDISLSEGGTTRDTRWLNPGRARSSSFIIRTEIALYTLRNSYAPTVSFERDLFKHGFVLSITTIDAVEFTCDELLRGSIPLEVTPTEHKAGTCGMDILSPEHFLLFLNHHLLFWHTDGSYNNMLYVTTGRRI